MKYPVIKYMLEVKAYLDSTSCEKNNWRGQSIEYSRVMSSQPSRSIVVLDEAARAFDLVRSTWDGLTAEGILNV